MHKRIFLLVFLLTIVGQIMAQNIVYPYRPLKQNINDDRVLYGVKGGINMPRMYYTDKNLKKLPHDFMASPTISLFAEFNLYKKLSMAIELNYQTKGTATSYVYEGKYNVTYKLKADYLGVRLPLYWYLSNTSDVCPYLFAGPDFAYVVGGNISLTQPGLSISDVYVWINDSNINRLYLGALAGVGARKNMYFNKWILVFKLDGAVNCGLNNTFAYAERNETATPTNIHAYNSQKGRYSVGFEINLSIGISQYNIRTNCFQFD